TNKRRAAPARPGDPIICMELRRGANRRHLVYVGSVDDVGVLELGGPANLLSQYSDSRPYRLVSSRYTTPVLRDHRATPDRGGPPPIDLGQPPHVFLPHCLVVAHHLEAEACKHVEAGGG